ncbi:MAG: metallophosphoesterase [Prevotella salivae]|jgi:putative purple acid phosphatase|uniref:FN3 domain-containing metallophosphoesterase family protein n=1 Tax=Segatella salivae TaxID=228604 RepID=UPI001CAE431C|nr:FN3 domain-containing metallophosphoesterase family protein [Segatella salivae]MBF1537205.1 metallophosphoesterase [Segatella salivae]MBF1559364.1 metallophosphoesterase [Segatella salivae]MBF1564380.1 metallophosphoesterase [Segatella salivae]
MKHLLLGLMLLFCVSAKGIKVTHGPWICDMDSTGVTIVWVTDVPGISYVEMATDSTDHFYSKTRKRYYAAEAGRRILTDSVHCVRIRGLKPDSKYRYRVVTQALKDWCNDDWVTLGGLAWSDVWKKKPYEFKTYPAKPREITFLVLNDIHERPQFMKELCKNVDLKKLDFVLLNGDMSNRIRSQKHIMDAYLDTCVSMFATDVPLFFNRGNHELRGEFADYLNRYFPTNNGKYYRLQHVAGVDFLFIDSGEDKPDADLEYCGIVECDQYREEQERWLRSLQEEKKIGKYPIVVFSHMPPTLKNWHGPLHMQETLTPELNKMNVSVMLSGHLHRFDYQEPNEVINFPNLVNSNNTYLLCHIANGKMEVDYVGLTNKEKKHFTFPLK